jgi:capsular polysaccharide transport system permease protein
VGQVTIEEAAAVALNPGLGRYVAAPGRWCATLLLLMAENFGNRHKRTRLAAIVAIVEPLGIIAIFSLVHSLIAIRPPFGSSHLLFFATGILPFYVFFHVSWTMRSWDSLRRYPRTTEFDLLLSHVLDEFLVKLIVIAVCYTGLWLWDVKDAFPRDPSQCLLALLVMAVLGVGVGLLNAVIAGFFFAWLYIYAIAIRGWMAFSGVLFVADWMPPQLREIAVYNPITHAITWYRSGHYVGYPTMTLDLDYLFLCTGAIVGLGWLTIDSTRRWRSVR